ncbi:hypothetical protein ACH35V_00060 [Actinomadura sp. 1N219]|uniref:hypothetical protein n=1 Tax=Actinomadura sp. 1N219 TaxID=3375152 RepID=UPI0037A56671
MTDWHELFVQVPRSRCSPKDNSGATATVRVSAPVKFHRRSAQQRFQRGGGPCLEGELLARRQDGDGVAVLLGGRLELGDAHRAVRPGG